MIFIILNNKFNIMYKNMLKNKIIYHTIKYIKIRKQIKKIEAQKLIVSMRS